MHVLEVIFIGVALSMDACALTFSNCTAYSPLSRKKEWAMPVLFAVFQAVMPLIGFYLGSLFMGYLETATGYVTAAIFLILAIKIIVDIIKENKEKSNGDKGKQNCDNSARKPEFTVGILFIQAIATSIDALAIGVTLNTLTFSVFWAVLIIGAVTFLLVTLSLIFGKSLGKLFGKYAQWVGAIILIALSVKSLVGIFI